MRSTLHILAVVIIAGHIFACDDTETEQSSPGDAGADASADVSLQDTTADAPEGIPATCEGPCRQQSVSIDFEGTAGTIERAVYGLTAPQVSDSGAWEVYIEALEGGFDGCPEQDSPTPDWTLIVSGLAVPVDAATYTKADDGLAATFLDYDGRFLGQEPFARATAVSVTPLAANVDTNLVADGAADAGGVVALEMQATFDDGSIAGHLVATHCPSLDQGGS